MKSIGRGNSRILFAMHLTSGRLSRRIIGSSDKQKTGDPARVLSSQIPSLATLSDFYPLICRCRIRKMDLRLTSRRILSGICTVTITSASSCCTGRNWSLPSHSRRAGNGRRTCLSAIRPPSACVDCRRRSSNALGCGDYFLCSEGSASPSTRCSPALCCIWCAGPSSIILIPD